MITHYHNLGFDVVKSWYFVLWDVEGWALPEPHSWNLET